MAKKSMIAREVKREKFGQAKYAEKRAALESNHQRQREASRRAFQGNTWNSQNCHATRLLCACTTGAS